MPGWRFSIVILFILWLTALGVLHAQSANKSANPAPKQEDPLPDRSPKKRGQPTIQFIEKRPAWAKPQAEAVNPEPSPAKSPAKVIREDACYGVQVGAFQSQENAIKLAKRLSSKFHATQTVVKEPVRTVTLHRVIIGCENRRADAAALRERLAKGGTRGFVVEVKLDSPKTETAE